MKKRFYLSALLLFILIIVKAQQKPNVLILYTDDLGYGDLSCYGAKAISTPDIDWLAENGLKFTNGHCTASTCTPSRYAIISGRYAWRKKGTGILPGDANLIIPTDITTLPKVFQKAGYYTGAIGKWHLGLGDTYPVNWNKEVSPGPKELGFDYSFIFPATLDRAPTVFMENQNVVGLDTSDPIEVNYRKPYPNEIIGKEHPELFKMGLTVGHAGHLVNGISRIGFMQGGKRAQWTDEEVGSTLNTKVLQFVDESQKEKKPFFLYYAIHDIHVPRMPATIFKGKSKLGYRGDAILEMNHTVGYIIGELKARHLLDNTIIIFSSDNGPVLDDGYADNAVATAKEENYKPAGVLRGGKCSIAEGGTRVPFIVYWKGHVKPNTVSDALVSQIDLTASFANFLGEKIPKAEFTDSRNYISTILGKSNISRADYIEQGLEKSIAIIKDGWKYIAPIKGRPSKYDAFSQEDQLYNLNTDVSEKINVASKYPKKVAELKALLAKTEAESNGVKM